MEGSFVLNVQFKERARILLKELLRVALTIIGAQWKVKGGKVSCQYQGRLVFCCLCPDGRAVLIILTGRRGFNKRNNWRDGGEGLLK